MEDIFTPETTPTLTPLRQARSKRSGRVWAITLGTLLAVAVAATAITLGVVYGTKKKNANGGKGGGGGGKQKPSYSVQIPCSGAGFTIGASAYGPPKQPGTNPILAYFCSTSTNVSTIAADPNYSNGLYLFLFRRGSSGNISMTGQYYDSGDPGDVSSFVNNFEKNVSSASFWAIATFGDASPFLTNGTVVSVLQSAGSTALNSLTSYAPGSAYCALVNKPSFTEDLEPSIGSLPSFAHVTIQVMFD